MTREECGGKDGNTAQNGLSPSDLGGNDTYGDVGYNGGGLGDDEGEVVVKAQDVGGVDRVLTGDGVVADVPQGDRCQDQKQGDQLGAGKLALGNGLSVGVGHGVDAQAVGFLLHLGGPLLLLDAEQEDHETRQHNGNDRDHIARVGHIELLGGGEDDTQGQDQDTAGGTRQVDDGVGLGAQGLDGDVGHEGHGGGAEGGHGDEHHQEGGDEAYQGEGVGHSHLEGVLNNFSLHVIGQDHTELGGNALGGHQGQLVVVDEGQGHEGDHGHDGTHQNEGGTLAQLGVDLIRDGTEDGEHEDSQDVVDGHDRARGGLGESEVVGEDQGDDGVVGLPEG